MGTKDCKDMYQPSCNYAQPTVLQNVGRFCMLMFQAVPKQTYNKEGGCDEVEDVVLTNTKA